MRLIDTDALMADCQLAQNQADRHGREFANAFYSGGGEISTEWWCVDDMIENAPTIEPDRENGYRDGYKRGKRAGYKKGMAIRSRITVDVIKDFHDYQVGWLTSHHDITLSPEEENLILNFLHDTADCYVLEVGALR